MSREITFRVWDREVKEMVHDMNITFTTWGKVEARRHYDEEEDGPVLGDIIKGDVMQWTGLKDKNGKKIYEGDILKTIVDVNTGLYIYQEVEFSNFRGCCFNELYTGYQIDEEYSEVIGNIYQNPELLSSDKLGK